MDIGLMGGGDSLYGKIYEGISKSRIVIACLTPRYVASRFCIREIILADVLHKPILPVMFEATPWPPPGPLALVMSSLVFVDLCGVGGHGGLGKSADSEARIRELVPIISRYILNGISPSLTRKSFSCPHGLCNHSSDPRIDLASLGPEFASNELIAESAGCSSNGLEEVSKYFESMSDETTNSEDNFPLRQLPESNDRITNCSICSIT